MRKKALYTILISLGLTAALVQAPAQGTVGRLLAKADSARLEYDFAAAAAYCRKAIETDSTAVGAVEEQLMMSENGQSMMDFCSQPVVVARQTFPIKDFFLYYPLKNHAWRKSPNQLDSLGGGVLSQAVYFPEDASDILYSAADEDGIRNIYRTTLADSIWTAPTLINEQLTSSSDEIYPMLSPDGESLYFASKGLYGMGGYDLYVSSWNKEAGDWDVPVNLGFPYSSPYDDFLFINTEDGRYSIFASNRDCGKDSVSIYVLEFDSMPVRNAVRNPRDLKALAELNPARDPSRMDNGSATGDTDSPGEETRRYMDKMREVRHLRDSVSRFNQGIDVLRSEYITAAEDKKAALEEEILGRELALPELNGALQKAVRELQALEMEFLANGVILDVARLQEKADKDIVGASSGYTFTRQSYGPDINLTMMKPEREFDYSFMILPEGRFAEDNTLPEGIVYQIQLFTQSRKATVADLKGLSPVFERKSGSRYICSAGLFRTYADALSNLNKVKRQGFRTAEIRAYRDGEPVSVSTARNLENDRMFTVVFYPANGQSLPEGAMELFRETGMDVAKSVENGSVVFKAGPFRDKDEAGKLITALKALGAGDCQLSEAR